MPVRRNSQCQFEMQPLLICCKKSLILLTQRMVVIPDCCGTLIIFVNILIGSVLWSFHTFTRKEKFRIPIILEIGMRTMDMRYNGDAVFLDRIILVSFQGIRPVKSFVNNWYSIDAGEKVFQWQPAHPEYAERFIFVGFEGGPRPRHRIGILSTRQRSVALFVRCLVYVLDLYGVWCMY